jgi:hypothetical protein
MASGGFSTGSVSKPSLRLRSDPTVAGSVTEVDQQTDHEKVTENEGNEIGVLKMEV